MQDRDAIAPVLKISKRMFPTLKASLADGGYQGEATANEVMAETGLPLEIVKRSDGAKGFVVIPKRWIVETHIRLVRTLSPAGQGLREPDAYALGFRHPGDDPPDAAPYRSAPGVIVIFPDRLLGILASTVGPAIL